jgi:hypothetical protein
MIMKKLIYAAVATLMILSGCEYHPYYDGQEFFVNDSMTNTVIDKNGEDIIISLQYDEPYVLECYGGKGKNYTITVSDPDCLGYSLSKSDVETPPFDFNAVPASVTLLPKKLGDTSITIKDDDTGESIQLNVHIHTGYHVLQLSETEYFFNDTVFAFIYGGENDVLKICKGSIYTRVIEPVVDGRYAFVDIDGMLYFEMTYPADENGRPLEGGEEAFRRYQVQLYDWWGQYSVYEPSVMLSDMNLQDIRPVTREAAIPEIKYENFRFVDATGHDGPLSEFLEPYNPEDHSYTRFGYFYTQSARLIPWIY